MQRRAHAIVAACALALFCAHPGRTESPGVAAAGSVPTLERAPEAPPGLGPALAVRPLDTLVVSGGYGEVRSNHFHAGWDFSTGGRVGRAVRAPLAGSVERVRASGAGYGRSLYLRGDDGRLLVFGHLDAFAPALAAHVDSAQRASGRYEQDLWPASRRFRFAAGDTIAWSGESGAGPPHLHVEIRHDDFAMHPLRAGLVPGRVGAPRLTWFTLEPLDADSRVAGGIAPRTIALHAAGDTLEAEGRLRAVVRSVSGVPGASDAPAWSTAMAWEGETVEARLDSISWAGEMSELDLLVDRGRIAGRDGLVMWAPAGFRPRFLRTSAPVSEPAGVIEVRRGDPPRTLRLAAREPGGAAVERFVVLRPPAGPGPAPVRTGPRVAAKAGAKGQLVWSFSMLPGRCLRLRVTGVPPGLDSVRVSLLAARSWSARAHWDGSGWVAILRADSLEHSGELEIGGVRSDGTRWSARSERTLLRAEPRTAIAVGGGAVISFGPDDLFEPTLITARDLPPAGSRAQGLVPAGTHVEIGPENLPLRRPVRLELPSSISSIDRRYHAYGRRGGGRWELLGSRYDLELGGGLSAMTTTLGEFAVMRDTLAPSLVLLAPRRLAAAKPYSRWQLVARVVEGGSGLDASESAFFVDGQRVPTEWDPEKRELRWRPLARPARGTHQYVVRAIDRAGNAASRRGTFVLDSARP